MVGVRVVHGARSDGREQENVDAGFAAINQLSVVLEVGLRNDEEGRHR